MKYASSENDSEQNTSYFIFHDTLTLMKNVRSELVKKRQK